MELRRVTSPSFEERRGRVNSIKLSTASLIRTGTRMKKITKKLDTKLRVLTANDLQEVVGGGNNPLYKSSAVSSLSETEVMMNPLYEGAGTEATNPLFS
jgi:hypothetical protein